MMDYQSIDNFMLKMNKVKESISLGDRVRGQKVIAIHEHFIVVTNGRYRDTFTWFDLAQSPPRKLKRAS
jgi:hypothetical protein